MWNDAWGGFFLFRRFGGTWVGVILLATIAVASDLPRTPFPVSVYYAKSIANDAAVAVAEGQALVLGDSLEENLVYLAIRFRLEKGGDVVQHQFQASRDAFILARKRVEEGTTSVRLPSGGFINAKVTGLEVAPLHNGTGKVSVAVEYADLAPSTDTRKRLIKEYSTSFYVENTAPSFRYIVPQKPRRQTFVVGSLINPWPAVPVVVLGYKAIGLDTRRVVVVERADLYRTDLSRIRVYLLPQQVLRRPSSPSEFLALNELSQDDEDSELVNGQKELRKKVLLPWTHRLIQVQEYDPWLVDRDSIFEKRFTALKKTLFPKPTDLPGKKCPDYLYEEKPWKNSLNP